MVNKVREYANSGKNIIIFPHGTRIGVGQNIRVQSEYLHFTNIWINL